MRIKQINPRGWYDIPGYDGKYQINYFGNVRRALKRGYKALHPYIKTTSHDAKASEKFHTPAYQSYSVEDYLRKMRVDIKEVTGNE